MSRIVIIKNPSREELDKRSVLQWPIWEKEVSQFPWTYDEMETCYILKGEVIVTPDGGEPVRIEEQDLVTFPAGMSCHWNILRDIRKHYRFG